MLPKQNLQRDKTKTVKEIKLYASTLISLNLGSILLVVLKKPDQKH